ncbi:MAG: hypothetical protein Q8936_06745 [Bacillota bacterium]|nr:hypothetical protein [Bacillota bacterium]
MSNATIGVICTIIGAAVGLLSALNYAKKEAKEDTACNTRLETKLDYIGKNVDDIKLDLRNTSSKIADMDIRIARVEDSTKSAHHRIDSLENK